MFDYSFIQFDGQEGNPVECEAKPIGIGERFPFIPIEGESLTLVDGEGNTYDDIVHVQDGVASISIESQHSVMPMDGACCKLVRYRNVEGLIVSENKQGVLTRAVIFRTEKAYHSGSTVAIAVNNISGIARKNGLLTFIVGFGRDLQIIGSITITNGVLSTTTITSNVLAYDGEITVRFTPQDVRDFYSLTLNVDFYQEYTGRVDVYSNPLKWVDGSGEESLLRFRCNEDEFGFPFSTSGQFAAWLPIILDNPQYSQEDKTYTKADGKVVTLFAKHYKEYDGQTEYLSEWMHDRIMIALSCDEVYIDNVLLTKSGNYEVDWEKKDVLEDGTPIARATFKMKENTINRNSNY